MPTLGCCCWPKDQHPSLGSCWWKNTRGRGRGRSSFPCSPGQLLSLPGLGLSLLPSAPSWGELGWWLSWGGSRSWQHQEHSRREGWCSVSAPCSTSTGIPQDSLWEHREALAAPLSVLWSLASCFCRVKREQCEKQHSGLHFEQCSLFSFSQCFGESWKGMTKKQEGGRRAGEDAWTQFCSWHHLLLCPFLPLLPFPGLPTNVRAATHSSLPLCANVSLVCPSALGTHGPAPHPPCAPGLAVAGTQQPQQQPQAPQPC